MEDLVNYFLEVPVPSMTKYSTLHMAGLKDRPWKGLSYYAILFGWWS